LYIAAVLALSGRTGPAASGAAAALPVFRDVTRASGVKFSCNGSPTSQKYLIETMVGGVASFDYDSDGWQDLYFVNGALLQDPMPQGAVPDKSAPRFWNRLYRNNGDGTFTDVTEQAGVRGRYYGMGVAVGDYDNDGDPDLYVTNFGRNTLFRNNGDGTFTDVTERAGVGAGGWSASAGFLDYDRDGWLDLFVSRYLVWDFDHNPYCGPRQARAYCHPATFPTITHVLYHNNRDGTFTDVSRPAGIAGAPGYGLGVAFNDYDRDGWPDIFVANDKVAEQLFHNRGDGTFEEVALEAGLAFNEEGGTFSGMGVDFTDYDNDGWPDIVVTALANERYALFRNEEGFFDYESESTGLGRETHRRSGWGLKLVDFDNDGWKDLFVGQSHVMDNIELVRPSTPYREPMLLLHNEKGVFRDVSDGRGDAFETPRVSRGAAFGDLDNDGFIDVAVNCLNCPAVILRNEGGNGNHWLTVDLTGTKSNRDGIGARLRLVAASGLEQYAFASPTGSYQSANDKRLHFGLGADASVKLLEIIWPSGVVQRLENVAADQILAVKEPAGGGGEKE